MEATELKSIQEEAVRQGAEIKASQSVIVSLETKAKELVQKIETENTKLAEYISTFENTRTKLDGGDDGLEAVFTWAQQQKEEIGKLLGQSRLDQAAVTEMKTTSAKDTEGIAGHKKEVEGYRKEIEKVYGFINGQGLAHSFSDRQKKLHLPLILWSIMLFSATFLEIGR